ncbi:MULTISPECIES: MurR/RpiR family transcriptional regulator [unclassified Vibrio]|uniref:MurR/RpiR family transcriptional regulator n=1 Tax=Vibrio sp. HB236076 TaxID=3232307 RepID=A0AB39HJS3_9VIBR|nr:MurR/RpiR family transcriptional regulator [Vibrio sp. HB161653]MDP5252827.1 MurR/RpiR family transcriptional regulator [Vibrio sp. HB161653]
MVLSDSLSQRITRFYDKLTESDRKVADYLQFHPEKVLILSTAEIADACQVSKTSISRFIRKLGYQDHLALRNELLHERESGTPMITQAIEEGYLQDELASIERLSTPINSEDFSQAVTRIANAKRVKVIGFRNNYVLALHCRQQLLQCRRSVMLLPTPGQTLGEEIADIQSDDVVVVFGFRRRTAQFAQLMQALSHTHCILITDQSGQKYHSDVRHCLVCELNSQGPLDSYAAPMSLVAHLVNQVYQLNQSDSAKVTASNRESYQMINELES